MWKPNFQPEREKLKRVTTIWTRLPLLPIEYQSPKLLISIGNLIGRIVALDASNSNILQATAIICIEVDIASNLPLVICLNGQNQEIIFEHLTFFSDILCPSGLCHIQTLSSKNDITITIPKKFSNSKRSENHSDPKNLN